jgi:hypothetical protein
VKIELDAIRLEDPRDIHSELYFCKWKFDLTITPSMITYEDFPDVYKPCVILMFHSEREDIMVNQSAVETLIGELFDSPENKSIVHGYRSVPDSKDYYYIAEVPRRSKSDDEDRME